MLLEQQATLVDTIRSTLNSYIGKRLHVRTNMGRSKIVEGNGVLIQVHPQLFIIEVDHKRGRKTTQSYQYVDVLTGTVQLSKEGEVLFEALLEELNEKPEERMLLEPIQSLD